MPKIRVYDNETTGLEPADKVCELGWTDLALVDGHWEVGETFSRLYRVEAMPPRARAIHHISAEETWPFIPFDAATQLWAHCEADGVDVIAAHNAGYDLTYWGEPNLPVICTLKAARRLFPAAPAHTNGVLRYWLQDEGHIAPESARCEPSHRAGADTYVTANILRHMLTLTTAAQMVAWTKQPLVFHVWGFGKHAGEPLSDTPADYLDWVLTKSKLDDDVKWNCQRELDRRAA